MTTATFRDRVLSGEYLAGTFLKTPAHQVIEVMAQSRLDFLCLDAEHAPFDRAAVDACMAVGRALNVPMLVRVGDGSPREILWALDAGATGIVVPHVDSVEKAADVARAARFGLGGRGFAGSTRWAGYATRPMSEVRARDTDTVVLAQIEEPAGVEHGAQIAATDGIDGLFLGPADLSVSYGHSSTDNPDLPRALSVVGKAARDAGKAFVTFVPDAAAARDWAQYGVTMFFIASEHAWMRNLANTEADGIHSLRGAVT